jgi:hypothetical protein
MKFCFFSLKLGRPTFLIKYANETTGRHSQLFRTITFEYTCYLFRLFTKAIIRHQDKNVREVISLQYTENITD